MELPFATLTPVNVVAKMAFSDVYDNRVRGRQSPAPHDIMATHDLRAEPEQKYNKDVLRFRREIECKLSGRGASESPTEPDTDAEVEAQHVGMVWTGHYDLRLQTPPLSSEMGWVAGKGRWRRDRTRTSSSAPEHSQSASVSVFGASTPDSTLIRRTGPSSSRASQARA